MKTTKMQKLERVLRRRWLSSLDSALLGMPISLSQRVGDLRRSGVTVIDRWVTSATGARYKEYHVVGGKGC